MRTHYFAYGSNLDLEGKLRQWAPSARRAGIGTVPDRRLAFTRRSTRWGDRAADLLPAPGLHTWGALFEVHSEDVEGLDACEGAPVHYRRLFVDVETSGGPVRALTYEVVDRHLPDAAPSRAYAETLLRGARDAALPSEWITSVERHIASLGG